MREIRLSGSEGGGDRYGSLPTSIKARRAETLSARRQCCRKFTNARNVVARENQQ